MDIESLIKKFKRCMKKWIKKNLLNSLRVWQN
jgi:hypothetical protein